MEFIKCFYYTVLSLAIVTNDIEIVKLLLSGPNNNGIKQDIFKLIIFF